MKKFIVALTLALVVTSGAVATSDSAVAQSWIDVARRPVPSYQPYRGYYGSQTYIGQNYQRRTYTARRYYHPRRGVVVHRRSNQAARAIAAALIIGAILAHR